MKVHLALPIMTRRDRTGTIANRSSTGSHCMKPLSRRRAVSLASSYLATAPLLGSASRAQQADKGQFRPGHRRADYIKS